MSRLSRHTPSSPLRISRSDNQIRLEHPLLGPVSVDATVVHRLPHSPGNLFSHGPHIYYGFLHEFSLRLKSDELNWSQYVKRPFGNGELPPELTRAEERALWEPLAPLGAVAPPSHGVYTPSRLLVARLEVHEIPYRLVQELHDDFAGAFDDDEELAEFQVVDSLRATDDGFSLRRPLQDGGSLLLVRGLEVHPAFAGQLLGARLLAHSIWELARHPGDLLYLGAYPWRRVFTRARGMPKATRGEVTRLVRYYERLGLHRAEPEIRITGKTHVRLYRHIGAFGFPISGLGWLSEQAGEPRIEPAEDAPAA